MKALRLAALVTCILVTPGTARAADDEAAWMFEPDHVTEIALDLPPASREALSADPDEYVESSFSLSREDGTTYGPLLVGTKLKGDTSFRDLSQKAAFKLKFDEFVDDQTFLGLKKLTLNSMLQDPTMLHELLAYEAFRAAEIAAPRTGYSYVHVNGEEYGLYLNIETPDDVFLPRWEPTTQHLFEGGRGFDLVPGDAPRYEVDEGDEEDLSDLRALIASVSTWEGIEARADLDQLRRYWAVEKYIGHWDGYSGANPNNYYLHSDEDGRFTMMPWGTDQTWFVRSAYGQPGGELFSRCLADDECKARYRDVVDEVRTTLGGLDLDRLVSETAAMLRPWQRMDPRREATLGEKRAGVTQLRRFLEARPSDMNWRSRLWILDLRVAGRSLVTKLQTPAPGRVSQRATLRISGQQREVCRSTHPVGRAPTMNARCRLSHPARRTVAAQGLVAVRVRHHTLAGRKRSLVRRFELDR